MGMLRIFALLLLVMVLFAPDGMAYQQDDVTQHLALRSVLRRSHDVFASNETGLYHAELRDKVWKQLPVPDAMPTGGHFAHQPDDSKIVLYYASSSATEDKAKIIGLYLSEDDGQTWRLLAQGKSYHAVFLHPNGNLFVAANDRKYRGAVTILMSKDLGKNWRDITGKSFGDILSIFADPDHPNLICLVGNSMRNYVFQVSDESYQWEATREWEWRREHQKTQEDFFSRYYSTTTILYQLDATLANYFAYNFGNSTTLPGFDIVPQKSVYEFEKSEAKPVQISVPFLFKPIIEHKTELWAMLLPYLTTKLIDQEKGLGLWGLKIVDPKGKQISIGPAVSDLIYKSRDREKTKQQLREKSGIQVHEVANDKPYEKVIDLGQLYGFAIPGTYKVQLVYDNSWLVDQAEGGWGGMFSGQVITVTINEDSNPMQRIWKHFKRIQNGYLESR